MDKLRPGELPRLLFLCQTPPFPPDGGANIGLEGGTRLKILDAWAMGKAAVTTSVGCEGHDARDGANLLVRDTPELLSEAIHRAMTTSVGAGR